MKIAICGQPDIAELVANLLHRAGHTTEVFLPDGLGGGAMDALFSYGEFHAVVELDLRELAAELFGLPGGAGPDRLTGAAVVGIPQVVCLIGCDNGLSAEQSDRLGLDIAQRLCASNSPTVLLIPPAKSPGAEVLRESIRQWAYGVEMIDVDESRIAEVAASTLLRVLARNPLADAAG
jgi:Uncharacterised protein family (UPF0261)